MVFFRFEGLVGGVEKRFDRVEQPIYQKYTLTLRKERPMFHDRCDLSEWIVLLSFAGFCRFPPLNPMIKTSVLPKTAPQWMAVLPLILPVRLSRTHPCFQLAEEEGDQGIKRGDRKTRRKARVAGNELFF